MRSDALRSPIRRQWLEQTRRLVDVDNVIKLK